jgi:hypothetical protein
MIKRLVLVTSSLLLAATPVLAIPNTQTATLSTPGTDRTLTLPTNADRSPVISLGTEVDPQTGKVVEGFAIIHYKKGFHHRPGHTSGKPGGGGNTSSACYSFFAKGAKWKNSENYLVDPTNDAGLGSAFVRDTIEGGFTKWEDAAGQGILGSEVSGVVDGADTVSPDGKNEVLFGDISSPGAIGVTIVWGIFRGPPSGRELVEWDQEYDDADFAWSDAGEAGKMDFDNIVTHEHGHVFGLSHPEDSCTEETMYRFATEGETKKQTLEAGDTAGINKLY